MMSTATEATTGPPPGAGAPDPDALVKRFGDKIRSAAYKVRASWDLSREDQADMEAEGFLWLLENAVLADEWESSLTDDEASRRVYRRVKDVMYAWMRKQRRQAGQGEPDPGADLIGPDIDYTWDEGFRPDALCDCDCHSGELCCQGKPLGGSMHDDCACLDDESLSGTEQHDAECQLCLTGACLDEPCGRCEGHLFLADASRAAWGLGPRHPDTRRMERRQALRRLHDVEREALWRLHRGDSQTGVARDLGMDQSGMSRAAKRARSKVLRATEHDS